MKSDDLPSLPGGQLKRLGAADTADLQRLILRCADFQILVTGAQPGPNAASDLLADVPPGHPISGKMVIGVEVAKDLVGVLDLLVGYPEPDIWYLGLLMLAPEARGGGLGAAVFAALRDWIAARGGRAIRLVTQDQNPRALVFWTRMEFREIGRTVQRLDSRENPVLRLELTL